jgi:FkbM family methyltransferase
MGVSISDLTLAPNVRLVEGRHGRFFVLASDTFISRSLIAYGEWTESEFELMHQVLQPNHHVVDIGANIGSHTVPFAKTVSQGGLVLAFEPQPRIFQLLAANVTINGLTNVRLFPAGCSAQPGVIRVPEIDYRPDNNYGGMKLDSFRSTKVVDASKPRTLGQPVQLLPLDDVYDLNQLQLIKIDVEGMELDVLRGAERAIRRFRPILYVENEFAESSEPLLRHLFDLDYILYWHTVLLFSSRNFRSNPENIFSKIMCVNVLCIPRESKSEIRGMKKVVDATEHPRRPRS